MTARVSHTTIDCRDAYTLSEWWKGVLDYVDVEGDPNLPGHEECMILSRDGGHKLLFIEVPEGEVGQEPHPPRPRAGRGQPRRRARPAAGARRRRGGRPPRPVRPRHRLGDPGRPRGQRVLHPAQPGRARGRARRGDADPRLLTDSVPTSTNRSLWGRSAGLRCYSPLRGGMPRTGDGLACSSSVGGEDDVEVAGAVHALDPVELDVAGGRRPLIQVCGRRGSSTGDRVGHVGARPGRSRTTQTCRSGTRVSARRPWPGPWSSTMVPVSAMPTAARR